MKTKTISVFSQAKKKKKGGGGSLESSRWFSGNLCCFQGDTKSAKLTNEWH